MHSIPARVQFEHGFSLLHRTFRLLQVTQLRGFRCAVLVEFDRAGWEWGVSEFLGREEWFGVLIAGLEEFL